MLCKYKNRSVRTEISTRHCFASEFTHRIRDMELWFHFRISLLTPQNLQITFANCDTRYYIVMNILESRVTVDSEEGLRARVRPQTFLEMNDDGFCLGKPLPIDHKSEDYDAMVKCSRQFLVFIDNFFPDKRPDVGVPIPRKFVTLVATNSTLFAIREVCQIV